jgi:hypothetical protein
VTPSSSDIEARVGAYYAGRLAEHGVTARGVDWNGEPSQHLRFEQLMRVVRHDAGVSVNDWGCGYGALVDWLDAHRVAAEYCGYDIAPAMVAAATDRYAGRPGVTFTADAQAVPVADYTVASGIFNVPAGATDDEWSGYMAATLERMAAVSRRGIAFNVLTSYSDPERMEERLHYADPCRWFDWCKRTLSRHVALLHDYGLYEFTILVRFDNGGSA